MYFFGYKFVNLEIDSLLFSFFLFIIFALPYPKFINPESYGYLQSQSYFVALIFFFTLIGFVASYEYYPYIFFFKI